MAPIGPYRRKTCTKCSKYIKLYLTCFNCNAVYHAKCLLKVPGHQVDQTGQAYCCRNITSKDDPTEEIWISQEKLVASQDRKYHSDEDLKSRSLEREEFKENNSKLNTPSAECAKVYLKRECSPNRCGGILREESHEEYVKDSNCLRLSEDREVATENNASKCELSQGGDTVKKYKCATCEYTVKQKCRLEHHIRVRHSLEEKKYKCQVCGYSAHRKYYVKEHMRVHAKEKPFGCDKCAYTTHRKDHLHGHVLAKHSNEEKKYKCEVCGYSAHKKSYVEDHMGIHAEEKPFGCDECKYTTHRKSRLSNHILAKHSNEEKRYKCGHCDFTAQHKSNLLQHERIHTEEKPFKCDKCEYASRWEGSLNHHVLIRHSGEEKKYKCETCWYSAHKKSRLLAHMLVHTKKKLFKCDECKFATNRRTNLNSHRSVKHAAIKSEGVPPTTNQD